MSQLKCHPTFSVNDDFPLSLIRAPSLERLYLANTLLGTDIQAVETFLRGVNHLNTLSLRALRNVDVATIIDFTPELDHLIFTGQASFLDALGSLASRSAACSLRKINVNVGVPSSTPSSVLIMHQLTNIIKFWDKHQLPKLHFLSVYVDNHGEEDMTLAVGDVIRLGTDKGLEVDISSTTFPAVLSFGDL